VVGLVAAALIVPALDQPASSTIPSATPATNSAAPTVTATSSGYITAYPDGNKVYSLTPVRRMAAAIGAHSAAMTFTSAGGPRKGLPAPANTPSSVEMLRALGAPESVLNRFAHFDDVTTTGTQVVNRSVANSASPAGASATSTSTAWSGKQLLERTCDGDATLDGGHLSTYGCWNHYVVYKDGLDWQLLDKFYMSATHNGGSNSLTGLMQGESYDANNKWVTWKPVRSWDGGNCATVSTGLSAYGASVSTSWQQCPETYGLHLINGTSYPIQFQTKWDGKHNGPVNGARDTSGLVQVHSPSDSTALRHWTWEVWWE
jgi:hypothetical protein